MRDEPNVELMRLTVRSFRYHKECQFIETARLWPWKSESAKECVTTHSPNELVSKMDGAQTYGICSTTIGKRFFERQEL